MTRLQHSPNQNRLLAALPRKDYARLAHINGIYIRQADDERLTRDVLERLAHRTDLALGGKAAERIRALMPALKERAKTLLELADAAAFLAHPLPLPSRSVHRVIAKRLNRPKPTPWRRSRPSQPFATRTQ